MLRQPVLMIAAIICSCFCSLCFGAALAWSQMLPPPPALPVQLGDESKLDQIIMQNKQTIKILLGVRDRLFMIESEQRERKIKEVDIQ